MRPHFLALAACRRYAHLRVCYELSGSLTSRRLLSSIEQNSSNAPKEDSSPSNDSPTVRISRIQAADRRRPNPKGSGLNTTSHPDSSLRVASFTPKGFQRKVYTSLIDYLKNRTSQNENQIVNVWKDFIWQWGGSVQRPCLPEISGLDWTFLPQVNGASFYNSASDGRSTSYGPWRIRVAMPLLTRSSPDIFTSLLGTFWALLLEWPSRN